MTTAPTAASDRQKTLRSIADAYFDGLANGDVSAVPYANDAQLRTPLAPGREDVPLTGRTAILDFFTGIYAAIGTVTVKDYYYNRAHTSICVEAEVELRGTDKKLYVADVFHISPAGEVTMQHNHYDPRAATNG